MAAAVPQFALAPGVHGGAAFIDYGTSEGQKLFKNMTTALKNEFDCSTHDLKVFLSNISDRAGQYGWDDVLEVPEDPAAVAPILRNLLTEYGLISIAQVQAHANTYVAGQTRQAQNSYALYNCIMATLDKTAHAKIMLKEDEYTINGVRSGPCLLKVVIRESYLDSNATTKYIRECLSSLDTYMLEVDSDIEKFNDHVDDLVDSLTARGEQTQDLLANLFKAYAACEDEVFTGYMALKESLYDEGEAFTHQQLMQLAKMKFATLKQKGKWKAQTNDQKKIIALEAQVNKLQNKVQKSNTAGKKDSGKAQSKASTRNKRKDFGEKKDSTKKQGKPEWMTKPPKEGEPRKKVVNDKDYWWCPHHRAWVRHTPESCRAKGQGNGNKSPDNDQGRAHRLVRALAAVAEQESDVESE